jgi:hypothetical protein
LIASALGVLVISLAACTRSSASSVVEQDLQRKADKWEIDQIEKNFHQATTLKDIDLMLPQPNATLPWVPESQRRDDRRFWLKSVALCRGRTGPTTYHKVDITVDGDRARCTSSATNRLRHRRDCAGLVLTRRARINGGG